MGEVLARYRGGIGRWENLAENGGTRTEKNVNIVAYCGLLLSIEERRSGGPALGRSRGRRKGGARAGARVEYASICRHLFTTLYGTRSHQRG